MNRRRDFWLRDLPTTPATKATAEATIAPPTQLPASSSASSRPGRRHAGTSTFVAATRHPIPVITTTTAIRFQNQPALMRGAQYCTGIGQRIVHHSPWL